MLKKLLVVTELVVSGTQCNAFTVIGIVFVVRRFLSCHFLMQFFLSMYGHKLPVLCLDISSDSTLLVTGSADRNVKIWGMDFGDCHKSIFAHDDR